MAFPEAELLIRQSVLTLRILRKPVQVHSLEQSPGSSIPIAVPPRGLE